MKNIKDIVIGIFAVIGFTAIVTGFTAESNQEENYPESHVWEHAVDSSTGRMHLYNKKTGELRKYALGWPDSKKDRENGVGMTYITYREFE